MRENRGWTISTSESHLACQACAKSHPQLNKRSKSAGKCQILRTSSVSEGLSGSLSQGSVFGNCEVNASHLHFPMCCSCQRGGSSPRALNDRISRLLYNLTLWLTGICSLDSSSLALSAKASCHFSSSFLLKIRQADVAQIQHLWLARLIHALLVEKGIWNSLKGLIEDVARISEFGVLVSVSQRYKDFKYRPSFYVSHSRYPLICCI